MDSTQEEKDGPRGHLKARRESRALGGVVVVAGTLTWETSSPVFSLWLSNSSIHEAASETVVAPKFRQRPCVNRRVRVRMWLPVSGCVSSGARLCAAAVADYLVPVCTCVCVYTTFVLFHILRFATPISFQMGGANGSLGGANGSLSMGLRPQLLFAKTAKLIHVVRRACHKCYWCLDSVVAIQRMFSKRLVSISETTLTDFIVASSRTHYTSTKMNRRQSMWLMSTGRATWWPVVATASWWLWDH